ncbi:DUF3859 domain-containing protein [Cypionkella sp.]|uniref:DUF3859 domain-containing protein n=1 Tax=Cypionkella sp. TaxID=2811411 RepID=UPI0026228B0F|nr:DUF3859 domain-containing protein [Cypionkella sp.]
MMGRCAWSIGIAFAFGCATMSLADGEVWSDPKRVVDVRVGIFCPPPVTSKSQSKNTISGDIARYSERPVLGRATNLIPAIDHILFGIEGRERPATGDAVTIEVTHPPLGAQGTRSESWTTYMRAGEASFSGYEIGLSDGKPLGKWTVSGTRNGKKPFSANFEVVKPSKTNFDPCERIPTS